jgi:hypothetical protein
MPIPIATLVFQDGRTQPVYKPLAGHEHLFRTQSYARPLAPLVKPISKPESSAQVAPTLPLGKMTVVALNFVTGTLTGFCRVIPAYKPRIEAEHKIPATALFLQAAEVYHTRTEPA